MKNNRKKFSAMLIAPDIIECRKNHQGILIAPFNDQKAKGIGYNISPSNLVYSIKKVFRKRFLTVKKAAILTLIQMILY